MKLSLLSEPGLYRAEQLKRVALDDDGNPVQNQLGTADVEALNDPSAREYVPWRILDERGSKVLVHEERHGRTEGQKEGRTKRRSRISPTATNV